MTLGSIIYHEVIFPFEVQGTYKHNSSKKLISLAQDLINSSEKWNFYRENFEYYKATNRTTQMWEYLSLMVNEEKLVDSIENEIKLEQESLFGSKKIWKEYETKFSLTLSEVLKNKDLPEEITQALKDKNFFKFIDEHAEFSIDQRGLIMTLQLKNEPTPRIAGVSYSNIQNFDETLAFLIMAGTIHHDLNAKDKNRSSFANFKTNWALFENLSKKLL